MKPEAEHDLPERPERRSASWSSPGPIRTPFYRPVPPPPDMEPQRSSDRTALAVVAMLVLTVWFFYGREDSRSCFDHFLYGICAHDPAVRSFAAFLAFALVLLAVIRVTTRR